MNDDSKFNLTSLIIELGNPKHGLDKHFGFPPYGLYDHFFTGKYLRTRTTMSLVMILIDFGASLKMTEAEDLYQNLFKFCGLYAAEHAAQVSADDEKDWTVVLEREWAWKLVEMFHNLAKTSTAPNTAFRHLLTKFNKVGLI